MQRPFFARFACALVLGVAVAMSFPGLPAAAEQVLTPPQMRQAALAYLRTGDPTRALQLANALLERDPSDLDALLLRSRALRDLGQYRGAAAVARTAWKLAETDADRFGAARLAAQALSSAGRRTAAQIWLRRAAQIAPDAKLKSIAVRDFRYVRSRNRFATHLNFELAPVSNVNGGSRRQTGTFAIPGIGVFTGAELLGTSRALSGTRIAFGATTRVRLGDKPRHQTDAVFGFYHRTFRLSDRARSAAPNAEGSDFDFTSVSASLIHRRLWAWAGAPFEASMTYGRTWYGEEAYARSFQFSLTQNYRLSPCTVIRGTALRRTEQALSTRSRDSHSWTMIAGVHHRLAGGSALDLALSGTERTSSAIGQFYFDTRAEIRYHPAKSLRGVRLEFGAHYAQRDFRRSPIPGTRRSDTEYGVNATAIFDRMEYYGFVPTLGLSARRNESPFGQFDTEDLGVRVGIRSAF